MYWGGQVFQNKFPTTLWYSERQTQTTSTAPTCDEGFTLRATQDTSVFSTHTQPFLAGLRSYWAVQGYCSESDSQSPAWRRRRWPTKTYDFWAPENGTIFFGKFSPKCHEKSGNSTNVTLQCFPVSHLGTSEDFRIHLSGIIEDVVFPSQLINLA